jgi:hypothetical protein
MNGPFGGFARRSARAPYDLIGCAMRCATDVSNVDVYIGFDSAWTDNPTATGAICAAGALMPL